MNHKIQLAEKFIKVPVDPLETGCASPRACHAVRSVGSRPNML